MLLKVWLECLCYWYYCYFGIVNLAMFLFILSLQGVLLLLLSIIHLFRKVTAYISIILGIIEWQHNN